MRLIHGFLCTGMLAAACSGPDRIEFVRHPVSMALSGPQRASAVDLDGDGDMDILSAADRVVWWENDGLQSFSEHEIDASLGTVIAVCAQDVDGDGDPDILGACYGARAVAWWENNGRQQFTMHIVTDQFAGAHDAFGGDINGDGRMDVLGAAGDGQRGKIVWWENTGSGVWTEHILFEGHHCHSVTAADLDQDGRTDILGTEFTDGCVYCWMNRGDGTFTRIDLPLRGAHLVRTADINRDGRLDILGAGYTAREIGWWENCGADSFRYHAVARHFLGAVNTDAADMDGDGDMDVLGGGEQAFDIRWWENINDTTFTEYSIAGLLPHASGVYCADMDGDGDTDVLGTAWRGSNEISWWENRRTHRPAEDMHIQSEAGFFLLVRSSGIEKAEAAVQKWLEIHPDSVVFRENHMIRLGYEIMSSGNHREAVPAFRLTLKYYPESWRACHYIGEACLAAKDTAGAAAAFQQSLDINPANSQALEMLARLNR